MGQHSTLEAMRNALYKSITTTTATAAAAAAAVAVAVADCRCLCDVSGGCC